MNDAMRNFFMIALLLIVSISGCQQSKEPAAQDGMAQDSMQIAIPDREGWDATVRITSGGDLRAVIKYGHMTYFNHNKINYFDQGVQVDMFDENGEHTTKLTAKKGEYHETTQDIWAIDEVVVVSDTGVTLHTPVGRWDQRLEKILSDTVVMVTTVENDTIYGTSFESNADLSHYIIENPHGTRQEGVDFEVLEEEIANVGEPDSRESQ